MYRIFVDDRESATTFFAASELADHLHQITGTTFPVVRGMSLPAGAVIAVGHRGDGVEAVFADLATADLGDDGFALRTDSELVVVRGASDRGDLYGVYWFLDRLLGVRWYADDFAVVPTRTVLTLPYTSLNRDCVPRFRHREVISGDATRHPTYRQRNLLTGNSLSNGSYPAVPELATWVGARLAWDPTLQVDDVIEDFLVGYYGPAAPHIDAYMRLLEQAVVDTDFPLRLFIPASSPYLSYEVIRTADQHLAQAAAAVAGDPARARHVGTVRLGLDYNVLLRQSEFRSLVAGRGESWDPAAGNRLARLGQELADSGLTENQQYRPSVNQARLLALAGGNRPVPPVPTAAGNRPYDEWVTVHATSANLTQTVVPAADPASSDGVCAVMVGTKADWGIQFPLSVLPREGTWAVSVALRVVAGQVDPTSTAVSVGCYPAVADPELFVPASQVVGPQFTEIRIPGTYQYDTTGRYFFVSSPNRPDMAEVRVDRLIAVRVG